MRDILTSTEAIRDLEQRLSKQVDRAEAAERALAKLEIAVTDFVFGTARYLSELPKKEFDALLLVLMEARNLLRAKENENPDNQRL